MFEKDEDEYNGNIGYEFRMAKDIFKKPITRTRVASCRSPVTNPIIARPSDAIVSEGATQFVGHEDVIKRFLGG